MKKIYISAGALFILFFSYYFLYNPDNYTYLKAEYAFNIYDVEEKVDYASDVFSVSEIKKVNKPNLPQGDYIPITYYEAVVEESYKGSVEVGSTVLLSQDIGYDKLKKTHVTFEGEKYLVDGNSYIISSLYSEDRQSYHVFSVTGAELLLPDNNKVKDKYIAAIDN